MGGKIDSHISKTTMYRSSLKLWISGHTSHWMKKIDTLKSKRSSFDMKRELRMTGIEQKHEKMNHKNQIASGTADICEQFNSFFINVCNLSDVSNNQVSFASKSLNALLITKEEVAKVLRNLNFCNLLLLTHCSTSKYGIKDQEMVSSLVASRKDQYWDLSFSWSL